jgi:hypothetical protein
MVSTEVRAVSSTSSLEITVIESGVFCKSVVRRSAVTITSWSAPLDVVP